MIVRIFRRVVAWLIGLMIVWLFLSLVWPTRYRFDHVVVENETYPVRIDRFTGDADMLTPDDGWVPMGGSDSGGSNESRTS